MGKRTLRKFLIGTGTVLLVLTLATAIHIWWILRPKAPDAQTRIMARIDIQKPIGQEDAARISAWLGRQQGVDHVLCNPGSGIAVFTFFPVRTNADRVIRDFNAALPYGGQRRLPGPDELKGGCPIASGSFTSRITGFFRSIF